MGTDHKHKRKISKLPVEGDLEGEHCEGERFEEDLEEGVDPCALEQTSEDGEGVVESLEGEEVGDSEDLVGEVVDVEEDGGEEGDAFEQSPLVAGEGGSEEAEPWEEACEAEPLVAWAEPSVEASCASFLW